MRIFPRSKFTWLLVVFAVYAYYIHYNDNKRFSMQDHQVQQSPENDFKASEIPDKLTEKVIGKISENPTGKVILDALVQKSFKDQYGNQNIQEVIAQKTGAFTIIDVLKGSNFAAKCGSIVKINYDAYLASGIKFDSSDIKGKRIPISFTLGKNQVIKGLEAGIIGMMENGKRKISIAPEFAFDDDNFTNNIVSKGEVVSYDVELLQIKPGPYKTNADILINNDIRNDKLGAICGDKITLEYIATNSTGQYKGTIDFIIGSHEIPVGINIAAQGLNVGGTRIVTIPPDLLQIASNNKSPIAIKSSEQENTQVTLTRIK